MIDNPAEMVRPQAEGIVARLDKIFHVIRSGNLDSAPSLPFSGLGQPRPLFADKSDPLSYTRATDCLTAAIYYESASESERGQRAVAQVVLNRLRHPSWPKTVCGVVFQGSERRTGCQFTFTCDGSLTRLPSSAGWARARRIATSALNGDGFDGVGGATNYHTIWISPYWAPSLNKLVTIGAHTFYRPRGAAGMPSVFSKDYDGHETISLSAMVNRTRQPQIDQPNEANAALASGPEIGSLATQGDAALLPTRAKEQRPHSVPIQALAMSTEGTDRLTADSAVPAPGPAVQRSAGIRAL